MRGQTQYPYTEKAPPASNKPEGSPIETCLKHCVMWFLEFIVDGDFFSGWIAVNNFLRSLLPPAIIANPKLDPGACIRVSIDLIPIMHLREIGSSGTMVRFPAGSLRDG